MSNRVGVFELDENLKDREFWLSKMNLHILAALRCPESFSHRIKGISPMFEELGEDEEVPEYEVNFHPAANGVEPYITTRRLC